ncbi:family 20 glycosylhydrolase [Flagellimonas olearia]|uniref:beta-N-acetylhexosaminidase n=1 Tax=Flagellimonas olearia TaxID=552546 RepID=A0A6I1E187_9FLAO|nr:glycoside hydrolase family 20 zincin-like fold domain-containing protein [Allomuricauda olearia]KAB7529402.1 family 20 glycosylhydrolase [Allomuricauda olearia]
MINRVVYCLMAVVMVACGEKSTPLGEFHILPSPDSFEISGVSKIEPQNIQTYGGSFTTELQMSEYLNLKEQADDADVTITIDENLDTNAEGYSLVIGEETIEIVGKDQAGAFYGMKTLEQLIQDAKDQKVNLPLVKITDAPKLAYRPIHLDVKHHLDTYDYYLKLINELADYKINAIIIEIEDKLKYTRRPIVGSKDALSKEQWKEISAYALKRNIRISPLVQGLGHASFVLKHKAFEHLRDDPKSDWAFNPLLDETYEVQFDLYRDALEAFPHGKYLHLGGDEVHTTGGNSGRSSLDLQLEWLEKVSQFAEEQGRIPIMWDDMLFKEVGVYRTMHYDEYTKEQVDSLWAVKETDLNQFLDDFPRNTIYMRWNYRSPQIYGNKKAMKWFEDHGLKAIGATAGQTRWVLMPQNESNIENIRSFALSSIDNGLNGLLLTLWDDDSPHFELYKRGILAFAEYAWAGDKRSKEEFKDVFRFRYFGDTAMDGEFAFIDALEDPVAKWKNILLQGNQRNYLKTMESPLEKGVMDLPDANNPGKWTEANSERIAHAKEISATGEQVLGVIDSLSQVADRNTYTLEVYKEVAGLVVFSANLVEELAKVDALPSVEERKKGLQEILAQKKAFAQLRKGLETVYSKTRILQKPKDYILDQDHHVHLANQSLNFDWQFLAEMKFFEKLEDTIQSFD